MINQKPEFGDELRVQVKGYGCDDDCREYFPKASAKKDHCGWQKTPKDSNIW